MKKGFSLLELMIVVVIVALITAIAPLLLPRLPANTQAETRRACRSQAIVRGRNVTAANGETCLPDGSVLVRQHEGRSSAHDSVLRSSR